MYQSDICRVDTNYADPDYVICRMPTLEDDYLEEGNFTWEDYEMEGK